MHIQHIQQDNFHINKFVRSTYLDLNTRISFIKMIKLPDSDPTSDLLLFDLRDIKTINYYHYYHYLFSNQEL